MDIILIILQVILLDCLLSIDNSVALAGIASSLPKNERNMALRAGIIGAFIFRGLMILFLGFLLSYPIIKVLGALYLLYLVGTHFFNFKPLFDFNFKGLSNFWKTVIMIEIADLAFSLDNVAAVVAITSQIWLIIVGVCISIFLMRFMAQLFLSLINWNPRLIDAAYLLIGAIAIELLVKLFGIQINTFLQFGISLLIILFYISEGIFNRKKVTLNGNN